MKERYEGVDGLKAYAIIGIALMHILTNGEYGIGGFVFERLTRNSRIRKSVWESSTPKDTVKFGRTSHCFVRWTL